MTIKEALREANKQLMAKINNAMTKEVFEKVRDKEVVAIKSTVYDAYAPEEMTYRRRGEYGGMADPYNIEIKGGAAKNGRMAVVNMTEPNPGGCLSDARITTGKNLPELIEYGDGYKFYQYDFPTKGAYMRPRPFTAKTIESLKESGELVKALKDGLKRQGVNVE